MELPVKTVTVTHTSSKVFSRYVEKEDVMLFEEGLFSSNWLPNPMEMSILKDRQKEMSSAFLGVFHALINQVPPQPSLRLLDWTVTNYAKAGRRELLHEQRLCRGGRHFPGVCCGAAIL